MGIGAVLGGVLGSAMGPVGAVVGGYLGSMAGEKIGEQVGVWAKSMVDADIGGKSSRAGHAHQSRGSPVFAQSK